MTYTPQVEKSHYDGNAYRNPERWMSYFHQVEMVRRLSPGNVLEIGLGEGTVHTHLRAKGIRVATLDLAPDLHPDVVGNVLRLPFPDRSFDVVLAAEVLEHLRFEDVTLALKEIARVASKGVVITLPHPGYVFSLAFKLPLLPRISLLMQIPFFWKAHAFNGEHYWELGKRGTPISRFLAVAHEAGLALTALQKSADDPGHRSFLFAMR